MQKNNKKLYIGLALMFLGVLLLVLTLSAPKKTSPAVVPTVETEPASENALTPSGSERNTQAPSTPAPEKKAEQNKEPEKSKNDSVAVRAGDVTVKLVPGAVFYDALIEAENEGKINFAGENYPGLGFLVTEIGTLRAGEGKYLLYYVNGKEATVGVSAYQLMDGDVIEWKLE